VRFGGACTWSPIRSQLSVAMAVSRLSLSAKCRYGAPRVTPAAKAVTSPRPRTRYTVGRDAALITRLTRMLSNRTLDRVIAAGLRRHYPRGAAAVTPGGQRV
jgi:hypothetical protein